MLPKGYRFELLDTVKRQVDQTTAAKTVTHKRKKVSLLTLFNHLFCTKTMLLMIVGKSIFESYTFSRLETQTRLMGVPARMLQVMVSQVVLEVCL